MAEYWQHNQSDLQQPYFSILIASTGKPCLKSALESVYASEDQDYEVILVVDNPNVELADLNIEKLPEEFRNKLKIIHNKSQMGVTKSLNRGLRDCSGQIVCRLDDDDEFVPKRLCWVREYAEKFIQADVFTGGALVRDQHGGEYQLKVPSEHNDIASSLAARNVLVHSALNIRRETLLSVGGYNEEYYYAQDYELYLRLLRCDVQFVGIDQVIVHRSEGVGSITIQKRKNQALYSFSALALHHARHWGSQEFSPLLITQAFFRFASPQFARVIVRRIRSFRRVQRL